MITTNSKISTKTGSSSDVSMQFEDSFELLLIMADPNSNPRSRNAAYNKIAAMYESSIIGKLTNDSKKHELVIEAWHDAITKICNIKKPLLRGSSKDPAFSLLFTMTKNGLREKIRYLKRRGENLYDNKFRMESLVDPLLTPDAFAIHSESINKLRAALKKLAPKQAEVLQTIYLEGITQREFAAKKGVSVNTVNGIGQTGLERMRRLLRPLAA